MAKMPLDMQYAFNKVKTVVLATSRADNQPNTSIVAMKCVIDDETIYLSDQFFKKTLSNVLENPKVSVIFFTEDAAYQIYGTARYVNEGVEFEQQAAWVNQAFEKMGKPIKAKGGCFIHVDAVYDSKGGPTAGDQIA